MNVSNWVDHLPSQEAYAINRVLYDVQHDRAEELRYFADPRAYLAGASGLSAGAHDALSAIDVGKLYLLGANPYLLRAFCLQLRMPEAEYLEALRAIGGVDENG